MNHKLACLFWCPDMRMRSYVQGTDLLHVVDLNGVVYGSSDKEDMAWMLALCTLKAELCEVCDKRERMGWNWAGARFIASFKDSMIA